MKKAKTKQNNVDQRNFRIFGCCMGACLLFWTIAGSLITGRSSGKSGVLIAAILIIGSAVIFPKWFYWPHRIGLTAANALAWLNAKILLGTAYYGIITPLACILRLFGYDPLLLKFDRAVPSYRHVMNGRKSDHFQHPY